MSVANGLELRDGDEGGQSFTEDESVVQFLASVCFNGGLNDFFVPTHIYNGQRDYRGHRNKFAQSGRGRSNPSGGIFSQPHGLFVLPRSIAQVLLGVTFGRVVAMVLESEFALPGL